MKQFLNVRGYCYKCMTAFYKAEALKHHDCEEMRIQYMRRGDSDDGEETESESESEYGDEALRETVRYLRKGVEAEIARRDNVRYLRRGESGGSNDVYIGDDSSEDEEVIAKKAEKELKKR